MEKVKLSDFQTQKININRHNPRGMGMLEHVISKDGWISAITVANDGETFAGSARLETAIDRFGDDAEPIVIDSDGTRPIIVRRIDIANADDPRAVRLGIADNRIHDVNAAYDAEILASIAEEIDISDMFFDDELQKMASNQIEIDHQEPDFLKFEDNNNIPAYASDRTGGSKQPIPIVVSSGTMKRWNEYKDEIGIRNDSAAFEKLLESYENG